MPTAALLNIKATIVISQFYEIMPLLCSIGSESTAIDHDRLRVELVKFLNQLGPREDVLILPPDYTRLHSQAGIITQMIAEYYKFIPTPSETSDKSTTTAAAAAAASTTSSDDPPPPPPQRFEIMPALGTHAPMTQEQISNMFGKDLGKKHEESSTTQPSPFLVHDWRNDVETIGYVPNEMVQNATRGLVDKPWPAQLNKVVWDKRSSNPNKQYEKNVIISIGQGKNLLGAD